MSLHYTDQAGASSVQELLPAHVTASEAAAARQPRCVRVNTLRTTVADALSHLRGSEPGGGAEVRLDEVLPDVLLLPPGTDMHSHPLVTAGALILQTRGSCMAAHALAPRPGWRVVDACAAPGNKTTHVAALMRGIGSVYAFDADPTRLQRLRTAVQLAGAAKVVTACRADFLSLDPRAEPLLSADAVLLDPSCSGSGTALTRGDALLPSAAAAAQHGGLAATDMHRIASLARFQLAALRHAMKCPKALRLVYSTCSIHSEENECVVAAALASPGVAALGWRLETALPAWTGRGHPGHGLDDAQATCLVRTDPLRDDCDGFFLALFTRDPPAPADRSAPRGAARAGPSAGAQRQQSSQVRWAREGTCDKKRKRGGRALFK
jgi:putative methyltransferase